MLYVNTTVTILDIINCPMSRIVIQAYIASSLFTKSFWCGGHFPKFMTDLFTFVIGSLQLLSSLVFIVVVSFVGTAIASIATHSSNKLAVMIFLTAELRRIFK
jgi:hypothetical protein